MTLLKLHDVVVNKGFFMPSKSKQWLSTRAKAERSLGEEGILLWGLK